MNEETLKHVRFLAKSQRYREATKEMKLHASGFRDDLLFSIILLSDKVNQFFEAKENGNNEIAEAGEVSLKSDLHAIINEFEESIRKNTEKGIAYCQVYIVINRDPKACSITGKNKIINDLAELLEMNASQIIVRKIVEGLIITIELPGKYKDFLLNLSNDHSTKSKAFKDKHSVLTTILRKSNSLGTDDVALQSIEKNVVKNMDIIRFIGKSLTLYTSNAVSTVFHVIGQYGSK